LPVAFLILTLFIWVVTYFSSISLNFKSSISGLFSFILTILG
jgi:hypothetical protein